MKQRFICLMVATLAGALLAAAPLTNQQEELIQEQEQEQEKDYTIAEVMKLAHKDGLLKKIATGGANDEEKKQLVALYKAMAKNQPPEGEEESWKEKTKALVAAAESAQKGEEAYADKLVKAADCKACHDVHK